MFLECLADKEEEAWLIRDQFESCCWREVHAGWQQTGKKTNQTKNQNQTKTLGYQPAQPSS